MRRDQRTMVTFCYRDRLRLLVFHLGFRGVFEGTAALLLRGSVLW